MDKEVAKWFSSLSPEDMEFIKNFILSSGSQKEISKIYGVSYPTIRLRLDRIIQNIEIHDQQEKRPFVKFIMQLVIEDKIELDIAKNIVNKYKEESEE